MIKKLNHHNLYGQAMSQKLPVNSFKWVEEKEKKKKDFIKNMMKIVIQDIF